MPEESNKKWTMANKLALVGLLIAAAGLYMKIDRCLIGIFCSKPPLEAKSINGWTSKSGSAEIEVQENADGTFTIAAILTRQSGLARLPTEDDFIFLEINRCVSTEDGQFRTPISTDEEDDAISDILNGDGLAQMILLNGRPDIYDLGLERWRKLESEGVSDSLHRVFNPNNFVSVGSIGRLKIVPCP